MKVKLAKTAGFCMGVRRAMEKVLAETHRENGLLYMLDVVSGWRDQPDDSTCD